MQRFQFILFFTLLALVFAVSARSRDDDDDDDEDYYPSGAPYGGYGPNGQQGGWVDEYGHWHSGASTQTIVKGALAVPAAIAIGFMAL
ncbi:unnamed protein product [Umbelopsis ramanniana]